MQPNSKRYLHDDFMYCYLESQQLTEETGDRSLTEFMISVKLYPTRHKFTYATCLPLLMSPVLSVHTYKSKFAVQMWAATVEWPITCCVHLWISISPLTLVQPAVWRGNQARWRPVWMIRTRLGLRYHCLVTAKKKRKRCKLEIETLNSLEAPPSVGEEDIFQSILWFSQLHVYWPKGRSPTTAENWTVSTAAISCVCKHIVTMPVVWWQNR